jgi:glucose/arabinose dehydrogenase
VTLRALLLLALVLGGGLAPVAAQDATPAATPQPGGARLERVADLLIDPVAVRSPDDGSGRLFVVEKIGRVRILRDGTLLKRPFLDVTSTVTSAYTEQGLLDIAFHPKFRENGLFYVSLTHFIADGALAIFEYRVDPNDPDIADPASQRVILVVPRLVVFHNGGTIAFGPDGYFYVGVGDGAPPYDVIHDRPGDLTSFDGKILRIDVDRPADQEGAFTYGVPANPFGGPVVRVVAYHDIRAEGREPWPEIWAYGLRNPWQFGFDPVTGDLWIPDVGQDRMEELNFQPAGSPGGEDYGWNAWEGTACRDDGGCPDGTVAPVVAYPHENGRCAITGIGVWRDHTHPAWDGSYFYGDYCTGEIWRLAPDGDGWASTSIAGAGPGLSGGGAGPDGALYVTTCTCAADSHADDLDDPALATGAVWRIVPLTEGGN